EKDRDQRHHPPNLPPPHEGEERARDPESRKRGAEEPGDSPHAWLHGKAKDGARQLVWRPRESRSRPGARVRSPSALRLLARGGGTASPLVRFYAPGASWREAPVSRRSSARSSRRLRGGRRHSSGRNPGNRASRTRESRRGPAP